MSSSFQFYQYSVLTAFSERAIYIKIVDTQCFMCYEGNVDVKELRLNLEIADIYTLINNCFAQNDKNYKLHLTVNTGIMKLMFTALVGGFLRINFDIMLREKLMSNDGQLTFNFTQLEQKLAKSAEELTQRCIALANENKMLVERLGLMPVPILLQYNPHTGHYCIGESSFYPANETKLELYNVNPNHSNGLKVLFKYIESFYQLRTLKITTHISQDQFKELQNATLEELVLHLDGQSNNLTSLQGIQQRLPNLHTLTVQSAPSLKDIPTVLQSAPHKITTICIKSCAAVNTVEIQTFCQTHGIKLEIA
jgi:hypothetical protein